MKELACIVMIEIVGQVIVDIHGHIRANKFKKS